MCFILNLGFLEVFMKRKLIDNGLILAEDQCRSFTVLYGFSFLGLKFYFEYRGNKTKQYKMFVDFNLFNRNYSIIGGLRINEEYVISMFDKDFEKQNFKTLKV